MYLFNVPISNFSDHFYSLRTNYHLTQEVFGRLLGLSRNAVSDIECDVYNPSFLTLIKFFILNGDARFLSFGFNFEIFYDLLDAIDSLQFELFDFEEYEMAHELNRLYDTMVSFYDSFIHNSELSITAQEIFCDLNEVPLFAPSDGICYSCKENIYLPSERFSGRTVMYARKNHITGCPHCGRSFCD